MESPAANESQGNSI